MLRKIEITSSQVRAYKSCRRLYELEYIEQLKPIVAPDALRIGSSYHKKIEELHKTGEFELTFDKTDAMAYAYQRFIMPKIHIMGTEIEFKKHLAYGVSIKGKIDGMQENGIPVEHKSAGVAINEDYVYRLSWDDQVAFYMIGLEVRELQYTVCQKPTIRQKANESEEEYLERCIEWYDEEKIKTFKVVRSKEELEDKKAEIINIAKEMRMQKFWPTNPSHCKIMGCAYQSICLNYEPEFLISFTKKERMNEELSE
jgi:hypothetical protein